MIPAQPESDIIGTAGSRDYQVTVSVSNVGEESGSRTVTLERDGTTVDSQNLTLASGGSQQITLTETGVDDTGTPFDSVFKVDTGNRAPQINARVIRRFVVDGSASNATPVPSQEVGTLDFQTGGQIAFNQLDEINFHR